MRLPHIAKKVSSQIHKTALGAELNVTWRQSDDIEKVFADLRSDGFVIAALEQTKQCLKLPSYNTPGMIAIVVGREVEGIEPDILEQVDVCLEIPMLGQKESFNVAQAAAMALYHCRFAS